MLSHNMKTLLCLFFVLVSRIVFAAPTTPVLNTPTGGQTVNQTNVNFNWSSSNATNYRIVISQYADFRGFTDDIVNSNFACDGTCYTTSTTEQSYTHYQFSNSGTTYYWKVRANNSNTSQASSWSTPANFYVSQGNIPSPPTTPVLNTPVGGQTVSQTNVNFSWSSSNATNYRIVISQYADFRGFTDDIVNSNFACDGTCYTTSTTEQSYTHYQFSNSGTTYYWKVRANNSNTSQASSWSTPASFYVSQGNIPSPPTTPVLNTPVGGQIVSQTNVNFSWSSSNATNYRIVISQYADFRGFTDDIVNSNFACDGTCYTTSTIEQSYTHYQFSNSGTTYYWKVRANNSNTSQSSSWSTPANFYISSGDNSAEKARIQAQIELLEEQKRINLNSASIASSNYVTKQQTVIGYRSEYLKNLTEQNSFLGISSSIHDLRQNDPILDNKICEYNASARQSTCNINIGIQPSSIVIRSQKIIVGYAYLTDKNYPVLVTGESKYDEVLTYFPGSTSDGKSLTSKSTTTPGYIANNQQQLTEIINYMVSNKESWSTEIRQKFRDDIKSIAAAAEISDYSAFSIEREKEAILEDIEQSLLEAGLSVEQVDQIAPAVADAVVSAIPFVGNGKAALETITGENFITLEKLSFADRALNVVFIVIPQLKIAKLVKTAERFGMDGPRLEKAIRLAKNRGRGLRAATYLKNHPELIAPGLIDCIDHTFGIPNKGVKGARRYPDVICDGVNYIESKVGSMSANKRLKGQLMKDIEIVKFDKEVTIYWVNTKSSDTGGLGFSLELTKMVPAELRGRIKFIERNISVDQ